MRTTSRIAVALVGLSVASAAMAGCAGAVRDGVEPDELTGTAEAELVTLAAASPLVTRTDGLLRPRLTTTAAMLLKANAVDVALQLGPTNALDLTAYDRARSLVRQRFAGAGIVVMPGDLDAVTLLWAVDAMEIARFRITSPSDSAARSTAETQRLLSAYTQALAMADAARRRMDESLGSVSQKIG